jgi:hypothetical protein
MAGTIPDEILTKLLARPYPSFHWIAVRCAGCCTDRELLDDLGLVGTPLEMLEHLRFPIHTHVGIADSGEWLWISDGAAYTMWNNPQTASRLERLSTKWEIFQYFLADCWDIYQVTCYRDGQLVRRFVVSEEGGKRSVSENFGEPLPGESCPIESSDVEHTVAAIAETLGITYQHRFGDVRLYEIRKQPTANVTSL